MPGAVPQTSTHALTNVTLPCVCRLAKYGLEAARRDPALAKGVNTFAGKLTYEAVAEAFDLPYTPFSP
jgi:alanine dehydrogenase